MVELPAPHGPIADSALLIEEERGGKALYSVSLGDLALRIKQDGKRRIGIELTNVGENMIRIFPLVDGKNDESVILQHLIEPFHGWHFPATRRTPGGPEIQENDFAPIVLQGMLFFICILQ